MPFPQDAMAHATLLTRKGKLMEATHAIQRALQGLVGPRPSMPGAPTPPPQPKSRWRRFLDAQDVEWREHPPTTGSSTASTASTALEQPTAEPAGQPASAPGRPGRSEGHHFSFEGRRYHYRLYTPSTAATGLRPVVVMLHGCKQDAADFERGTAMNALAEAEGCMVVYPEQLRTGNSMGCWNWFEPAHQQRGSGEPGMIAALAQSVVDRCGGDPERVYVAGLSAGGAMAAMVAHLYPDVFAAVGVHSGLPPAAANGVVSAFSAMRKANTDPLDTPSGQLALPTIVFHGDADRTVHPDNGDRIAQQTLHALQQAGVSVREEREQLDATDRSATRIRHLRDDGQVVLEQWEVETGPHAWSGGHEGGSYTDPDGPSASEAMLAFFLRHHRGAQPTRH